MYKNFMHNSSPSRIAADDLLAAIEYSGLTGLYAKADGDYTYIYIGDSSTTPDGTNILCAFRYTTSGGSYVTYATPYVNGSGSGNLILGNYNSIIAVPGAIGIGGCNSTEGVTNCGIIITKDSNNRWLTIFSPSDNDSTHKGFDLPRVAVKGVTTIAKTLSITTVTTFGTTTLVNFPSENLNQEGYYVDKVFKAVTGTLAADGECTLNNNIYWTFKGQIFLLDSPAE